MILSLFYKLACTAIILSGNNQVECKSEQDVEETKINNIVNIPEGTNPISSITFTPGDSDVTATIRLRQPISGIEPLLMRSDTPNDPDSYVLVAPLEAESSRNDTVYKCELPNLDSKNSNRVYSILLEIGGDMYSTESFRFCSDENSYSLVREIKNGADIGMHIWACVGMIFLII